MTTTTRPTKQSPTPKLVSSDRFNLHQFINELIDELDMADPRAIAEQAALRIPVEDRAEALAAALVSYVRMLQGVRRTSNPMIGSVSGRVRPVSHRSQKTEGIRENWQRFLKDVVHVGNGQRKFLGECGYEDLMFAARERQQIAMDNQAAAERYENVATMLVQHKAKAVRDLPRAVLRGLFVPEAA